MLIFYEDYRVQLSPKVMFAFGGFGGVYMNAFGGEKLLYSS